MNVLFVALFALSFSGCGFFEGGVNGSLKKRQDVAINDMQEQTGIVLPSNIELLDSGDGGGRDGGYGYYEWVLFSPSSITLPKIQQVGVNGYLRMPLEPSVRFIESRLKGKRLPVPSNAWATEWTANGSKFYATLVETKKGTYLIVERFRIKT